MQTTANTNRFLTGCSSSLELTDSEILVSRDGSLRYIVAGHLAQTIHSRKLFGTLANQLIAFAEHAYIVRNLPALEEVSHILMNLPVDAAQQIGTYYYALAINRKGQRDLAETLLGKLADDGPFTYRARAIQSLGGNLHDKGKLDEALRLQREALRAASEENADGLQTMLKAHFEIAIIRSLDGDHNGALSHFEKLWPIVNHIAKQNPFYFYLYHNAVAVELGEVGRVEEAEVACKLALASPFASAYPEWAETRQELEAKRRSATSSIVAQDHPPEAKPSLRVEPQCQSAPSRPLNSSYSAKDKVFFQRSVSWIPATTTLVFNTVSTLDRVLICIRPRAPPLLS